MSARTSLLKDNGGFTSSKQETVSVLLDTHFPGSREAQPELEDTWNEIIEGADAETTVCTLRWIDRDTVKRAMASFIDFKACGPDEIKPIMLKNLPESALDRFVLIFTAASSWVTRPSRGGPQGLYSF